MKPTFLILSKLRGEDHQLVQIAGPFFKDEVLKWKPTIIQESPELLVEDIDESWIRENYLREYRFSFMTRPLFYIVTHITSLELTGTILRDDDKNIAYNNQLFLAYDPERSLLKIAFTRSVPAEMSARLILALTKYIIKGIDIRIQGSFWLEELPENKLRAWDGKFVAQKDLLHQYTNQFQE